MHRLTFLYVTVYLTALRAAEAYFYEVVIPRPGTAYHSYDIPYEDSLDVVFYAYSTAVENGNENRTPVPKILEYKNFPSVLDGVPFLAGQPTVFITHGFQSSASSDACTLIRDAYLNNDDFDGNVIVVDWSPIASRYNYVNTALHIVRVLGEQVGLMLTFLEENNFINYNNTILVGHSLGAHVMGIAGYSTHGRVKAVFGLDPAGPGFEGPMKSGSRLSKESAQFVQAIHTNVGVFGSIEMLGHVDFFLNDGAHQPGCNESFSTNVCSHSRGYEYFAESINSKVGFWGRRCEPDTVAITYCFRDQKRYLGGLEPDSKNLTDHEIYGAKTAVTSPYALGDKISSNSFILYWRSLYYETFSKLALLTLESVRDVIYQDYLGIAR